MGRTVTDALFPMQRVWIDKKDRLFHSAPPSSVSSLEVLGIVSRKRLAPDSLQGTMCASNSAPTNRWNSGVQSCGTKQVFGIEMPSLTLGYPFGFVLAAASGVMEFVSVVGPLVGAISIPGGDFLTAIPIGESLS
jgi:hypothetical protein